MRFDNTIWQESTLGQVCTGFDYGIGAEAINFDGLNKYIRITDIDEYNSHFIDKSKVSPSFINENCVVKENDILFARTGASTGKSYLYNKNDGKLYFAGFLIRANVKNEFSSYFIYQQTKIYRYKKWVKIMSERSGQPGINAKEYQKYKVYYPNIKTQLKISSFLTLIDQRIDTQSKIIEDLELFKKSIENQYFYCDKSNDYASLGDIITQLNSRNEQNKDFEVLSVSNKYGFIPQSEQFDDHEVASANKSNYKIVKQNDFAYNPARINVGSIAMLRRDKIGIVSPMYICFRANNNKILSSYLDYFTHSNKFNKEVLKNLEGSVRLCLSFESLSKIKIYVPSLSTQSEIVKNLDLINNKIFIENKILEKLKEQKKYLLSNMFI